MTQLKTKSGVTLFTAVLAAVEGVELHKENNVIVAVKDGVTIGEVETAKTFVAPGSKAKAVAVKLEELIGDIDPTTLIGKDPTTLTQEELIALTTYLQGLSTNQVAAPAKEEAPKAKTKVDSVEEDIEEDEEDGFELPEGLDTYEAIAALGVKQMWAEIGKHIAAEAGIKARTPKYEMLDAIAEYFELEPLEEDDEEEEVKPSPKARTKATAKVEEEEDEDDEEFEDEDEDDFEDEEDDIDEDDFDDEDDIDEYDEDEDEDDEEDEVTEEDVEALFETGNKAAIVAFCKEHGIVIPKKRLSAATIKQIILDELFGDE